ncbi:SMP-30/gluconolactonase/LRE family protein [Sinorhizobium sp. BG8]|uniref:SMP-30/gluconolactonase/LRE family protein n=1 Tax=Sinorhizobium sp. BG8 TaxID=2613773 RepID=UPI00193E5CD1|nr:SMP-30/gluconolactonase/LRE family protein [Sinorhizobium sp. BG8]QRM57766.1 SMP-30/gluconolactonase/LRE family protein [Sinorhizobium sp. BG8]
MLDACFNVLDERFRKLVMPNVHVEKLFTGCRWSEGPAYFPAGRYLVWSDIPNDRMMRWDETDGSVSVFRSPAFNSNGNTRDLHGRLVTCEHGGRCVSRTEFDGSRRVLASHFQNKRLNSPNDVVVKSDGSLWFTDPSYGIDTDYEGDAAEHEIGGCNVYRLEPESGELTLVANDFQQPNGLAFSPDESLLYIADTGATHSSDGAHHIRRFSVNEDGVSLSGGEVFAECTAGLFDGFRVDTGGNLWSSAADGVHCISPDGTLIGKISIPEVVANLCFGGRKRNRLFICGTTSLYSVYVNASGALPRA